MPTVSQRKVLQDLGYAPRLNPPEVVGQPAAFVRGPNVDANQVNQLVRSLGEFNSALQEHGDAQYQRKVDEAPAKALETLKLARAQTEKTIGDYVGQSLITEGASPKVRQLTYQLIGERMAAEDYNRALFDKRNRVATESNPENPEDIIIETRKEFLQRLGDNMFIKQGADSVMLNAENSFRANSRAAQDAMFEESVRSNVGVGIQQTIEGSFGDLTIAPEAKAEGVNKLFDYLSRLRASGVKNPTDIFITNVTTAVANLAQQQKYAQARELIEAVEGRAIVDDKGVALGVFGQREDAKGALTRAFQMVDNLERQNEERNESESNRARVHKENLGKEAAANIVADALAKGRLFDPQLETEIRTAVEAAVPASIAGGNGSAVLAALSVLTQYRNAPQGSDPQASVNFLNALESGNIERAEAIMNGPTVSAQTRVSMTSELNKARGFTDIMRSPSIGSALNGMQAIMRQASKAVAQDGSDVIDDLTPERQTIISKTLGAFRNKVFTDVKAERAQHPEMDNDTFSFSVLPGIVAKHQESVLNAFNTEWKQVEQRAGFGEVDPSGKELKLSKKFGTTSEPWFRSMTDSEKVANLNAVADSVGFALEQSGGELSLFDPKSKQALTLLARKKAEYWPVVSELGKTIAADPTKTAGLASTYFNIRNRFGYTTDEVLSGVTREGVTIPIEDWQKRGLAFTTPMFGTAEDLKAQVDSYRALSAKLSKEGITPEEKLELEAQEEVHPIYRLSKALNLTNDRAVGAFIKSQEKVLRALGNVTPATKIESPKPGQPNTPIQPPATAGGPVSRKAFEAEFNQPAGLDWFSQSNRILEQRNQMRQALFSVMAEKLGVKDQQMGSSTFSTPGWKRIASDPAKYDALFSALPKAEQDAVYGEAMSRARQQKFSPIKASR